jgi:hypothetical protein
VPASGEDVARPRPSCRGRTRGLREPRSPHMVLFGLRLLAGNRCKEVEMLLVWLEDLKMARFDLILHLRAMFG